MKKSIQLKNVSFEYRNHEGICKTALDDISLEIPAGQFIAIVGSNGSGKSTLAKHINALLLPKTGQVLVNGLDTKDDETLWEIRKSVGMVFQNPDNQLVATIVEEDVAFGAENLGIPRQEIIDRVAKALDIVEMTKHRKKAPHMLSGGQKQRVAIAGVLALNPEIIVFDESTAMLDPKGRKEIMDIAQKLHESGNTIIFITHFMEEAKLAERIIVLDDSKIVLDGTPMQVFENTQLLKSLSLDVPKSLLLANRLQSDGILVNSVLSVEDLAEEICQKI